jgi:hypothetical protein
MYHDRGKEERENREDGEGALDCTGGRKSPGTIALGAALACDFRLRLALRLPAKVSKKRFERERVELSRCDGHA